MELELCVREDVVLTVEVDASAHGLVDVEDVGPQVDGSERDGCAVGTECE